jgi:hypothetical protein
MKMQQLIKHINLYLFYEHTVHDEKTVKLEFTMMYQQHYSSGWNQFPAVKESVMKYCSNMVKGDIDA